MSILKQNKLYFFIPLLILLFVIVSAFIKKSPIKLSNETDVTEDDEQINAILENPLSITRMRSQEYPGSDLIVEGQLSPGSNYSQFVVSYLSEGNKIYALLTVPKENGHASPTGGFPAIVFNHGYIPPQQYETTERYVAYVDSFARNGYVVLKPDYRGHGNSEGEASGGYGSPNYTIDVLNAVSSLKRHKSVDPNRLGMWGHSMGGHITLRSMVVTKDIKAGVIWAGVVASYPDLLTNWRRGSFPPPTSIPQRALSWRQLFYEKYGSPSANPTFWNEISPNNFLSDISGQP
ncbi:MAG: alpha/beta fold hydrolase [Patescibacteria group bacterium]